MCCTGGSLHSPPGRRRRPCWRRGSPAAREGWWGPRTERSEPRWSPRCTAGSPGASRLPESMRCPRPASCKPTGLKMPGETQETSRYNGSTNISSTLKCCPLAGSKYNKPGEDIEIRTEVVYRNEFVRRNFNFLLCFSVTSIQKNNGH